VCSYHEIVLFPPVPGPVFTLAVLLSWNAWAQESTVYLPRACYSCSYTQLERQHQDFKISRTFIQPLANFASTYWLLWWGNVPGGDIKASYPSRAVGRSYDSTLKSRHGLHPPYGCSRLARARVKTGGGGPTSFKVSTVVSELKFTLTLNV